MNQSATQQKSDNTGGLNQIPSPTPDGGSRGVQPKTPLGPKPPRPTPPPGESRSGSIVSETRGDAVSR